MRRLLGALIVCASAALTQCVDTSPLAYAPDKDAGVSVDAAADAPLIRSCRRCLEDVGAPCRAEYDACGKVAKCLPVLDCIIDKGCFEFPLLPDRLTCGLPCLDAQSVVVATDPTTTALGQINVCIVNSCSDACFMK